MKGGEEGLTIFSAAKFGKPSLVVFVPTATGEISQHHLQVM